MLQVNDAAFVGKGTKFKLFPQPGFLPGFEKPEVVWVSPPAGTVKAGPADDRMYVVDAIEKIPYPPAAVPPYVGAACPPTTPDKEGHFDYLDVNSRSFGSAHLYGGVRRVLDIWEGYLGRPIDWHFEEHHPRLELIPYVNWDNAQAGYGFLETGSRAPKQGEATPFCLNFDVIAHETGHLIIFSVIGIPIDNTLTAEYLAYHESASDIIALISALHFDAVVSRVLDACHGNLFTQNELSRIGELSGSEQIRLACHGLKLGEGPDPNTPWHQLCQKDRHRLGEPMTGAVFDMIVEVFQELLVQDRLISRSLADRASCALDDPIHLKVVQGEFDHAYHGHELEFCGALKRARDIVGERLARTWEAISPHNLHFTSVATKFLTVDRHLTGEKYQNVLRECLLWRKIGYGLNHNNK
jgi:hypothetical protein